VGTLARGGATDGVAGRSGVLGGGAHAQARIASSPGHRNEDFFVESLRGAAGGFVMGAPTLAEMEPVASKVERHQSRTGVSLASFRNPSRIVAWFGDAPGHDPSVGHTEADATASLLGDEVRVLAVSVGANQLDATGQATRITQATGGALLTGVSTSQVAAKILEGLHNLPVEVAGVPSCDPGLSVGLDPASQTVTSGTDAVFTETITVADDAEQGATLTCSVPFTLNGADGGPGFTQTVQIHVNDVTAPTVSCDPGPNPAGHLSRSTANGFVMATAGDNVDDVQVTVTDLGSGQSFGPYASGTTFKLVKAPGGQVSVRPGSGAVDWNLRFTGNAQLSVTDSAGNTATAVCSVPPNTP